jgi:hypothetical protein
MMAERMPVAGGVLDDSMTAESGSVRSKKPPTIR